MINKAVTRISFQFFVLVLSGFWIISGRAFAQDGTMEQLKEQSKPITLSQAINVALANNTEIKRSLLTLKTADQQVRIAWSDVLPDIEGSMSYTRNLEIPVNFVPAVFFDPDAPEDELVPLQFGTDNNWSGGFSVSQTLFRGEAIVGINSAELFKAAQAENMRATSQQIVTQTRIAYYNALIAEQQVRLQQATVQRLRENLEENRARQRAGLLDQYDVLQVEVQLSNQEPQLTQARYAVLQAYRELKLVMGLPLEMDITVEGNLGEYDILDKQAGVQANQNIKKVDQITPYVYEKEKKLIDIATGLRGDIRVLEKQNELKEREIAAIKSRFLPSLSANYNLNWAASQPGSPVFFGTKDTRARSQTVMVTLSVPLFQGFERSADLNIARIEKKDLEEQRKFAIRSAKNEIQSAKESLNQAIETYAAREKALEQAREGYRRAKSLLENGIGSQLDVTNAEFQLREAELNYAQMVYNYLVAKAQYDQAIGMVPFVDEEKPELN